MIKTNAQSLADAWKLRADALAPTMKIATQKATAVVYAAGRLEMTQGVYGHPVPTVGQEAQRLGLTVKRGGKDVPAMWLRIKGKRILVPIGKEGNKKAWVRTGNLRRSEKMTVLSPYLGMVYNDATYAAARHEMGKETAKLPTRWPSHWRDEAVAKTAIKRRQIYRDALRQAMQAGIISGLGGLK